MVIIEPDVFGDDRGYFFESYNQARFDAAVRPVRFVQDNESKSKFGVLRGLHFQCGRAAQSKLVRVVKGKVLDVAGDIRSLLALRRFRPGGFVDLQQLAPDWGIEEKSLRKLSAIVLGKRVSKAQRLSNWEAAQLTEKQMRYAATDAWICPEIYRTLQHTLKPNDK